MRDEIIAMKSFVLILGLSFAFHSIALAQFVEPDLICPLPVSLHESSGLEYSMAGNIWTHNDSGDSARIFNIDTLGNILRIVYFDVDTAVDCEESTRDAEGNYYLGDFGNNQNDRTNLRIYKIPDPDTITTDTVVPQLITFRYPDQTAFPPDSTLLNFDCEAMFHFQDSLYLFSKNRGTSTYCKMYRIPDQPGDYIAELVDSFNTGTWVTAADISPSGEHMVLLSESRIWLFSNISGSDFFGGDLHVIMMYTTQKEAVVFANDSLIYLTDEYFWGFGGNLYQLRLQSWINHVFGNFETTDFIVYPNPAENMVYIQTIRSYQDVHISLYDSQGHCISTCQKCDILHLSGISSGIYFLEISTEEGVFSKTLIKK